MLKATKATNIQEGKLRKSFCRRGQRDYLKKLITEVQERLGVRIIVTRNLHSVEACVEGLCKLTKEYAKLNIPKRDNLLIIPKKKNQEKEIHFLKTEIENLNEYISKLEKQKKELEFCEKEFKIAEKRINRLVDSLKSSKKENDELKNKVKKLETYLKVSNDNIEYFKELYKKEKLSLENLKPKKWWQIWG